MFASEEEIYLSAIKWVKYDLEPGVGIVTFYNVSDIISPIVNILLIENIYLTCSQLSTCQDFLLQGFFMIFVILISECAICKSRRPGRYNAM